MATFRTSWAKVLPSGPTTGIQQTLKAFLERSRPSDDKGEKDWGLLNFLPLLIPGMPLEIEL
jgi:hypothetical protein